MEGRSFIEDRPGEIPAKFEACNLKVTATVWGILTEG
jgi:hypothetical protein